MVLIYHGGTVSGSKITGSDITGSTITIGDKFFVSANGIFEAHTTAGGYIKMGGNYNDHPTVSGLNCDGGINMWGHGISNVTQLSGVNSITGSGNLNISAGGAFITGGLTTDALTVNGTLSFQKNDGKNRNLADWYANGKTYSPDGSGIQIVRSVTKSGSRIEIQTRDILVIDGLIAGLGEIQYDYISI